MSGRLLLDAEILLPIRFEGPTPGTSHEILFLVPAHCKISHTLYSQSHGQLLFLVRIGMVDCANHAL